MLFTVGFAGAAVLLVYWLGSSGWYLFPLSAAGALGAFFLPRRFFRVVAAVLLGFAVGVVWCSGYHHFFLAPADGIDGKTMAFTATVEDYPSQVRAGKRVEVTVDQGDLRGILYVEQLPQNVAPGDRVRGVAVFEKIASGRQSDDLYYQSSGVLIMGRVEGELTVTSPSELSLPHTMARFSQTLRNNLQASFPASSRDYFTALVTGDRSGLSYSFLNDMSICGLYHAVSLSGMHVSVLMGMILALCGRRKKLAAMLGIPILMAFLLISGLRPSTVRAVMMYGILLASSLTGREYDPLTSLSFALLVLLLQNPWCIAQWGLQLSFLSTAGILVLYPKLLEVFRLVKPKNSVLRWLWARIGEILGVSLAATMASLPLMMLYFGVVSIVAPLANLLALWSVMWSFLGGIFTAFLAFLSPVLAADLGGILHLLYRYLEVVLRLLSPLPLSAVYDTQPVLFAWAFLWHLVLMISLLLRAKWYIPFVCVAVSLTASLLLSFGDRDKMTMLDVGQGQCIVLSHGGKTYLVDCGGTGDETGELAARFLLGQGISRVDGVILTHFDTDHTDGLVQLMNRIEVDCVYYPALSGPSEEKTKILRQTGRQEVPGVSVSSVTALSFSTGEITLYPSLSGANDNDSGLCILASVGECDMLITGDLSQDAEALLLSRYRFPDLEVLVAGHHGSQDSTGMHLLTALQPETVLISAGRTHYGHPAQQTLQRLAAVSATAYVTKDSGNLTIRW